MLKTKLERSLQTTRAQETNTYSKARTTKADLPQGHRLTDLVTD